MGLEELDCFGHYEKDDTECINCEDSELCKKAEETITEDEQSEGPIITDTTYAKTPWDKDGIMLARDKDPSWWYYLICLIIPILWPFLIYKTIMWVYRKTKN